MAVTNLAIVELAEGQAELFVQELIGFHEVGHQVDIAYGLKGLVDILVNQHDDIQRAVQLFGAADALLATIGAGITPRNRIDADSVFATARAALDPTTFMAV